jgi:hypothetical protein
VTLRPKPAGRPVSPPYLSFQNLQGQVEQVDGGFYIRAAGNFAVLDHGDQYGCAYLPQSLGATDSAVVKLENADFRSNWVGRTGIMVRKEIAKAGLIPRLPRPRRLSGERLLPGVGLRWRRPPR